MAELKHFGVKGMRWGIRRSDPINREAIARNDTAILNARRSLELEKHTYKSAKKDYRVYKKQYRANKGTLGRERARDILKAEGKTKFSEAKNRYRGVKSKAGEETSTEAIDRVIRETLEKQTKEIASYSG